MTRRTMIFDCDGTLLNSIDAWDRVLNNISRDAGIALTEEDNDIITTLTVPETGDFFHERFGLGNNPKEVVAMIDNGLMGYYTNHARERAGALDFVQNMVKLGVTCSVASSSPQTYLQVGLKRAGFTDYLYEIVSVDDVGASKRDPLVFEHAARLMGSKPADTWVVEDSLYALHTARNAGFRTIGIFDRDAAGTFEELSQVADIAVKNFGELNPRTLVE